MKINKTIQSKVFVYAILACIATIVALASYHATISHPVVMTSLNTSTNVTAVSSESSVASKKARLVTVDDVSSTPISSQADTDASVSTDRDSSLISEQLYIDPGLKNAGRPSSIADRPTSLWLGNWTPDVQNAAHDHITKATEQKKLATIVAYNIPHRDCGSYSAGGSDTSDAYRAWINNLADGIGKRKAIVVLEPDALAQIDCLAKADQEQRYADMRYAVDTLAARTNAFTYIDAGHSKWIAADDMTNRLKKVNIHNAKGFALNVSNFQTNASNIEFGDTIAIALNKQYVIDTSRNGNGPNHEWCNPEGRALGAAPTTNTGGHLDAFLWIKTPGESDGTCNGGPSAGQWWAAYADNLIRESSEQ